MRLFILTILLLLPFTALADTPITQETAQAYYKTCLTKDAPMMSDENKDLMCSCTAAKMMETMSVEDVQAMSSQETAIARPAANKLIIDVYAPCIEFPARDYYYMTCVENPETSSISSRPRELCECMSDEVSGFLAENAQGVFADILDRDPMILDPMEALAGDPDFQKFAEKKLLGCYARYK